MTKAQIRTTLPTEKQLRQLHTEEEDGLSTLQILYFSYVLHLMNKDAIFKADKSSNTCKSTYKYINVITVNTKEIIKNIY